MFDKMLQPGFAVLLVGGATLYQIICVTTGVR